MYYIVESDKSVYEASVDLEEVILRLGFAVQHREDLGAGLRARDIDFDEEALLFEIGSARPTAGLLAADIRLALCLPWRISVFTEEGVTKLGLIRPSALLPVLSPAAGLSRLACDIEEKLMQVVDEAR